MSPRQQDDKRAGILRTVILLVIVFIVGSIAVIRLSEGGDIKVTDEAADKLAACLTDKGVKMYGAYWCSHCATQKKMFGEAFSKVDYIECASPGKPYEQAQECKDAGITGYPTWVFADGSRLSGDVTFQNLAEKAGCPFGAEPETALETPSVSEQSPDAVIPDTPAEETAAP